MDELNDQNYLKDDISYEKYRYLLELKKEKEIDELIKNKNLTIQEKIIINLEKELNQLKLEQKNILYSNEEMLKLDPNDKVVRESIQINIAIYNKNEKRIKEIAQKIIYLNINSEENNNNNIKGSIYNEQKKDINNSNIQSDNISKKDNNKTEDILKELEL